MYKVEIKSMDILEKILRNKLCIYLIVPYKYEGKIGLNYHIVKYVI